MFRRTKSSLHIPDDLMVATEDFETIRLQFEAHGLISIEQTTSAKGAKRIVWSATPRGRAEVIRLRTVQSAKI